MTEATRDEDLTTEWLISAAWRHKWLIIIVTLFAGISGAAGSYLIKPAFRADTLLSNALQSDEDPLGGLASRFGSLAAVAGVSLPSGQSTVDETIEVLRSRELTSIFAEKYGLTKILFAERWDDATQRWRPPSGDQAKRRSAEPTAWELYRKFNLMRHIAQDEETGLIKLSITWTDPKLAAFWTNELVKLLNEHLRREALLESQRAIAFLNREYQTTQVAERREMILGLIETQTQKAMISRSRNDYALRVIDVAIVPEEKVKPKRAVIAVAAAMAGLLLSLAGAIVWEANRRRPKGLD